MTVRDHRQALRWPFPQQDATRVQSHAALRAVQVHAPHEVDAVAHGHVDGWPAVLPLGVLQACLTVPGQALPVQNMQRQAFEGEAWMTGCWVPHCLCLGHCVPHNAVEAGGCGLQRGVLAVCLPLWIPRAEPGHMVW